MAKQGENIENSDVLNSSVYIGEIRHRRFLPVKHELNYPIFMLYLDLDELTSLFETQIFFSLEKFNLASFNRTDYLNPSIPDLKKAVIDKVYSELGIKPSDENEIKKVRMLTNVRYCGFSFNPVTFYYCYNNTDQLVAIAAEITNTPWGERHTYALPIAKEFYLSQSKIKYEEKGKKKHVFQFDKNFHVSPFNPMNMRYRWAFSQPQAELLVHMDNFMEEGSSQAEGKHFDATLTLKRHEFSQAMPRVLFKFPVISLKVVWGIYWNALKLWLKRSPFYDHPNTQQSAAKN